MYHVLVLEVFLVSIRSHARLPTKGWQARPDEHSVTSSELVPIKIRRIEMCRVLVLDSRWSLELTELELK